MDISLVLRDIVGILLISPKPSFDYVTVITGNRQARKATEPFLFQHSVSAAILIFSNTVCVTMLAYYTAYLVPLALFPCKSVSRHTDKRTVFNRSFDWGFLNYLTVNVTFRRTRM